MLPFGMQMREQKLTSAIFNINLCLDIFFGAFLKGTKIMEFACGAGNVWRRKICINKGTWHYLIIRIFFDGWQEPSLAPSAAASHTLLPCKMTQIFISLGFILSEYEIEQHGNMEGEKLIYSNRWFNLALN